MNQSGANWVQKHSIGTESESQGFPLWKFSEGALDQWEASIWSSRPMRSLDFGQIFVFRQTWSLPIQWQSDNRKTFWCHRSTNPMLIGSLSSMDWQPIRYQGTTNLDPIDSQLNVNRQPIWCQLIPNEMYVDSNRLQIKYQTTFSLMPITNQSDANKYPIRWKFSPNQKPIKNQFDANWLTMECFLTSNLIPIDSQLNTKYNHTVANQQHI